MRRSRSPSFFFLTATPTTEIYTLSLHDALPISERALHAPFRTSKRQNRLRARQPRASATRSEEHTSELQSPDHLVCRLPLEKKKLGRRPSAWPVRGRGDDRGGGAVPGAVVLLQR